MRIYRFEGERALEAEEASLEGNAERVVIASASELESYEKQLGLKGPWRKFIQSDKPSTRVDVYKRQVEERNLYMDKLSGKDFNRPQYRRLMRKLRPEDVLVIKSIDRLGRNYKEILEQWRIITKEKRPTWW